MNGWTRFAAVTGVACMALAVGAPAGAQERKTACSKIMDMCMKRAGSGHAAICEDMYSTARKTGAWPATQEPDGTKHAPVPRTP
jgi:hypothetical protein